MISDNLILQESALNPAFLNEAPTQEQIDASPALQALQALKYEEDNPDGNYNEYLMFLSVNNTLKFIEGDIHSLVFLIKP